MIIDSEGPVGRKRNVSSHGMVTNDIVVSYLGGKSSYFEEGGSNSFKTRLSTIGERFPWHFPRHVSTGINCKPNSATTATETIALSL